MSNEWHEILADAARKGGLQAALGVLSDECANRAGEISRVNDPKVSARYHRLRRVAEALADYSFVLSDEKS